MHALPARLRSSAIVLALATLCSTSYAMDREYISDIIHPYQEGLAGVFLNQKWGFVDKTGQVVITPQYDEVSDFQHGLAAVKKGNQAFFIDKTGKIALVGPYKEAEGFNGNSAIVTLPSGKIALIDTAGKIVSEAPNDLSRWYNSSSSDRLIGYRTQQLKLLSSEGKLTLLSQAGAYLLGDSLPLFAFTEGDRQGLIDLSGKEVAPAIYESIQQSTKNRLITRKDGLYGLIDYAGKVIVPNSLHSIGEFRDGLAVAAKDSEHIGLMNPDGQWVVAPTLEHQISIISPTLYSYDANGKTIYKNLQGQTIAEQSGYANLQLIGNQLAILRGEDGETGEVSTRLISISTGQDTLAATQLPGDSKQYQFEAIYNRSDDQYSNVAQEAIAVRISKRNAEEVESVGLYLPKLAKFYPPIWKEVTSGERDGYLTVDMDENASEKAFLLNATTGELSSKGAYFISGYENNKNSKYVSAYASGSQYGVMDLAGNWVIQPQFEEVMIGDGDQLVAGKKGYNQWQILDMAGKPVWPETFEDVSRPDGDTLFGRKNKQLLLLKAGQPPKLLENNLYLLATRFGERGSIPVRKRENNKVALLGKNGEWLTPPIFDDLSKEEETSYYRQTKIIDGDYFYGLVDGQGKEIIPARFRSLEKLQDSFFVGCASEQCRVFNRQGKEINPQIQFKASYDFKPINSPSLRDKTAPQWASVQTENGSWFVNSLGKSLFLDDVFEEVSLLQDQTLVLKTKQTQAIFDASGKQLTPWGDQVDDLGDILMWQQNGKHQVFDPAGKLIAPLTKKNAYISWVGEGRWQTDNDRGDYTLETLDGQQFPLPKGMFIYSSSFHAKFVDGLAIGTPAHGDTQLSGYLNTSGKWAIPPKFRFVDNFAEGTAVVMDAKGQQFGYINKTGKSTIPYRFTAALPFSEGMARVSEKNREDISVINTEGKTLFHVSARCGNNVLTDANDKVTWQGKPCVNFIESKIAK